MKTKPTGLALFLSGATALCTAAEYQWKKSEQSLALTDHSGAVIWQFNHPPAPIKPHFHPVGLPGQPALTWKAPPDHIWHLGLWFSWKYINGRNYWETNLEGRSEGLTRLVTFTPEMRTDGSARLEMNLAYQEAPDTLAVLREQRTVDISAPGEDGSFRMDWTMTFTAGKTPVHLDRTALPTEPDGKPWGGYAGLTWRFAKELEDWRVVNSNGLRDMTGHGKPSPAADFSGRIGKHEQGVAILDHPQNLRAPTPWYIAMEKETPFACLIASPLFQQSYQLPSGESFTLKYRVVIHPRRWGPEELQKASRDYVRP